MALQVCHIDISHHCPICFQVKTVGQPTKNDGTKLSEYIELVDGIYLNEIMLEM